MNRLKGALARAGLSYAALASEIGVSKSSVVEIVLRDRFPRGREAKLRRAVEVALSERGVHDDPWPDDQSTQQEDDVDVRTHLSLAAREQFGLRADPWDVRSAADVWLGRRWRYAAQAIEDAAQTGGFLAVVGESGCGKSTLRRYVQDALRRQERPVRVVEPVAIDRGRLTAASICDAIVGDLSQERPRLTPEWKTRQVRRILTESSRAGCSNVMILEEAHDLHISTLKYLKRFWELEDGFERLLGIILLAQPEIMTVLDERAWAAREVVRRIEVVELGALDEGDDLEQFLAARIGDGAFAADAADAIRARLSRRTRGAGTMSTAWPLAVANLVTRCLNLAAELGQSQVTADTVAAA